MAIVLGTFTYRMRMSQSLQMLLLVFVCAVVVDFARVTED